jgi:hypothetical protein
MERRRFSLQAMQAMVGCLTLILAPLIAALFGALASLTAVTVMLANAFAAALLLWALGS